MGGGDDPMTRFHAAAPAARVVFTLASAALYAAAYPPIDARWTAPFALVPLFLALRGATAGHALR